MPEGPEVRTNAEQLRDLIYGKRISLLKPLGGKLARQGVPGGADFTPGVVTDVRPIGKLIVIELDHDGLHKGAITSTLGMSGWWYPGTLEAAMTLYAGKPAYFNGIYIDAREVIQKALKHARVGLIVDGQQVACYTDPRNFGNMQYHPNGLPDKVRAKIGIDLLNELPRMVEVLARHEVLTRKHAASNRLLNMRMGDLALEQSFIAGLGNIYRAEVFWLLGLNPSTKLRQLNDYQWLQFCDVAMTVLENAYRTKGLMLYSPEFIEACTGVPLPKRLPVRGHLCYGKSEDIYGNKIIRDDSFSRPLWRLA